MIGIPVQAGTGMVSPRFGIMAVEDEPSELSCIFYPLLSVGCNSQGNN